MVWSLANLKMTKIQPRLNYKTRQKQLLLLINLF